MEIYVFLNRWDRSEMMSKGCELSRCLFCVVKSLGDRKDGERGQRVAFEGDTNPSALMITQHPQKIEVP